MTTKIKEKLKLGMKLVEKKEFQALFIINVCNLLSHVNITLSSPP